MSLWNIDDNATKDLMLEFLRRVKSGAMTEFALRDAMLATRQKYSDPALWGALHCSACRPRHHGLWILNASPFQGICRRQHVRPRPLCRAAQRSVSSSTRRMRTTPQRASSVDRWCGVPRLCRGRTAR